MSTRNGYGRSGGFTLRDLLVVIAVFMVLVGVAAVFLPILERIIEFGQLNRCKMNLRFHGNAFFSYRDKNEGHFPTLYVGADPGTPVSAATSWGEPESHFNDPADREAALAALGSNAMQNMWLIVDGAYIGGGEAAYKCPEDRGYSPRTISSKKYGWTSPNNFSYSVQFPYAGTSQIAIAGSAPVRYALPGAFGRLPKPDATWNWADPNGVIAEGEHAGKPMYPENCIYMADRNPRTRWDQAYPGNSNHEDFINFVEKCGTNGAIPATDSKIGLEHDDVYTNRKGTGGLPGVDAADLDAVGRARGPCTDTVLWPLNQRTGK